MYTLYGKKGSGSASTQAALEITGAPYRVVETASWEPNAAFTELLQVNPLGQIPTLVLPDGSVLSESAAILIHQAAKSVKLGRVGVKLSFHVSDVEAFKVRAASMGVMFGATHKANGYVFANVKDPDRNSVSISSRAFRKQKPGVDARRKAI